MATVLDLSDATAAEEVRLPELYEIIDGQIVESPTMSAYAVAVANRLNRAITRYLFTNDIGESEFEQLYRIPLPEDRSRNRRPDLAYVSYERWPRAKPYSFSGNARNVVPDIAVEVVSPGDLADEVVAKAREYLRGGVRLVWVAFPLSQEIHAYLPGTRDIRVSFASDELEAGDILPGFRTSVGELFPPTEPPAPAIQGEQ